MKITIDSQRRTPVYQQIADDVKRLVGSGALRPGDRVDSVRELSHALGVNPATVAKAYRDLVSEGVLRTTSKSGTFVGGPAGRLSRAASLTRLGQALDRFFAEVAACSLEAGEIADAFQRRLGAPPPVPAGKPPAVPAGKPPAVPAGKPRAHVKTPPPRAKPKAAREPRTTAVDDWAVW